MDSLEVINDRLQDYYGLFTDGRPNFRLVWSDDQFETRFGTFDIVSEAGVYLKTITDFMKVRKYQHMPFQWVLEKLMPVPEVNLGELTTKTTYEPIWGYNNIYGRNLPPWGHIRTTCDTLMETVRLAKSGLKKYHEGIEDLNTKEGIQHRVDEIKKKLDENTSPLLDSLSWGEGVSVPNKEFEELNTDKSTIN